MTSALEVNARGIRSRKRPITFNRWWLAEHPALQIPGDNLRLLLLIVLERFHAAQVGWGRLTKYYRYWRVIFSDYLGNKRSNGILGLFDIAVRTHAIHNSHSTGRIVDRLD